jgi:site-specific DNA-methyltransferase (adenine-specific)
MGLRLWLSFPKSHDVSRAIDDHLGARRRVVGRAKGAATTQTESLGPYASEYDKTIPATPEAGEWSGWGSALKPVARARLRFWEQHPTDLPIEKA